MDKTRVISAYWHDDPAHAWLAVKRIWLDKLGIADKTSIYSYQRGDTVYLEEDLDAERFIKESMTQGYNLTYKPCRRYSRSERNKPSRVRSYDRYLPTLASNNVNL